MKRNGTWRAVSEEENIRLACFTDYIKATDHEDSENQWDALKELGMPQYWTVLMCNLYCEQEATVRIEYRETESFPVGKGVRQGCILSPHLICMQNTAYEKLD